MENFINNAPFALVLVCLVIGFVLLIKGADFFVEGSSSAAKRLHVPSTYQHTGTSETYFWHCRM